MKKISDINNGILFIVAAILLISSFLYFQFVVPYHFFFKEQIQLFIYDSTYILPYFSKPGGLACLIGDFLTQFLYFKYGGATVISTLLILEWLLIIKILHSFSIKQMSPLWALFPIIVEIMYIWEIDFSIAMSVSFALVLLAIYIYTKIRKTNISLILGILFIPTLYILIGSAMFLFPLFVILHEIYSGKKRFFYFLSLIVLSTVIPYLFRSYYLITVNQAYFYPYLSFKQQGSLITIAIILFVSCVKIIHKLRITFTLFSSTVFFILVFAGVGLKLRTNTKREKLLGMAQEYNYNNLNKVLKIAEISNYKDAIMTYYTNLALSGQNQLGDRMMEFYQPFVSGLFLPVNSESNWFIIYFSGDVFYHIGDMNLAQHSAMLSMSFSPYSRSSHLIKRLIEINISTGDIPAAMKYIRILEASWFHKKTALKLKEIALSQADNKTAFNNLRSKIHKIDFLRSSQNQQKSLEFLVKSDPENNAALNYLLSYHLMSKNIPAFFNVYNDYLKGKINIVPKMYAEALLIYFAAFKTKPEKIMEYGIDINIIKNFNEYTNLYESSGGNLGLLQKRFPNTYFLFYHFATLKNE